MPTNPGLPTFTVSPSVLKDLRFSSPEDSRSRPNSNADRSHGPVGGHHDRCVGPVLVRKKLPSTRKTDKVMSLPNHSAIYEASRILFECLHRAKYWVCLRLTTGVARSLHPSAKASISVLPWSIGSNKWRLPRVYLWLLPMTQIREAAPVYQHVMADAWSIDEKVLVLSQWRRDDQGTIQWGLDIIHR